MKNLLPTFITSLFTLGIIFSSCAQNRKEPKAFRLPEIPSVLVVPQERAALSGHTLLGSFRLHRYRADRHAGDHRTGVRRFSRDTALYRQGTGGCRYAFPACRGRKGDALPFHFAFRQIPLRAQFADAQRRSVHPRAANPRRPAHDGRYG